MRTRWLAAVGLALLGGAARAQPVREAPCDLPPLLPAPVQPGGPLAEVPRPGPGVEYDHGYQYLPEQLPARRLADEVCGPPGKWWVNTSFDLTWASTRTAPGTVRLRVPDPANPGATVPGPRLPVGGLDAGQFEPAFSLALGYWFGDTQTHGIDASFFVRDANTTFLGYAPGMSVLFPGGTDRSAPRVVVLPDPGVVGAFPATIGTFFTTFDVNYRNKLFCNEYARLDGIAGYRYAFLGDELYPGDLPDGNSTAFRWNRAAVSNTFNGAQLGLAGEVRWDRWYLAGGAKVGLGVMTTKVTDTGMFVGAQGRTAAGFRRLGALVPTEENNFAALPVVNVQVGRQLTPHARVFAGYTFNYLSRVGRLGDVLDPANAGLKTTDFWVQAINLGAEFRF
jgi:hypothetical protein